MSKEGENLKNYNNKLVIFIVLNFFIYLYLTFGMSYIINLINGPYFTSIIESSIAFAILGLVAFILTSILPTNIKEILVFWRIKNTLPSHRSFSKYAKNDPRIDEEILIEKYSKLPTEPKAQHNLWYKLSRIHEYEPMVFNSHRSRLLARDLTSLSFLIIPIYPISVLASNLGLNLGIIWSQYYLAYLIIQFILIAIAAQNLTKRFVCNVLAQECIDS